MRFKENKKILCLFSDSGGGHRQTAKALHDQMTLNPQIEIDRIDVYQEVCADFDWVMKMFKITASQVYNWIFIKKGWTFLIRPLLFWSQVNLNYQYKKGIKRFEEFFNQKKPALILSVMNMMNHAFSEAASRYSKKVPFVILMTDFAEGFPNMWIQTKEAYYICSNDLARKQIHAYGVNPQKVFQISGPVLDPRFYQVSQIQKESERLKYGLDPKKLTIAISYGAFGGEKTKQILRDLENSTLSLQVIVFCGHNKKLQNEVEKHPYSFSKLVLGFTDQMAYFLKLADLFIGKPGPASVQEALLSGLPVLTQNDKSVLPWERFSAQWIKEKHYGWVYERDAEFLSLLKRIPQEMESIKAHVAQYQNRGLFEVEAILKSLLDSAESSTSEVEISLKAIMEQSQSTH